MKSFHQFVAVLLLGLLSLLPQFGFAQYRVGSCSGATHSGIQGAFNDLMASSVSGTFTIEICPGTYVDPNATLGHVNYTSPGSKVVITKAPFSGNAVLQAVHPAAWTVLTLDSVQNVEVRNLTFEVTYSASRTGYIGVKTLNGAGEILFDNCTFQAYAIPSGSAVFADRLRYSMLYASNRDGDLAVENCEFIDGGTGIYIHNNLPGATDTDLNVENCTFTEPIFSGLSIHSECDSIRFQDNHVVSHGFSDRFYGVENRYITSNHTQMEDNLIVIENKQVAFGLTDDATFETVSRNEINAHAVYEEFVGIRLDGYTREAVVDQNEIYYHRSLQGETVQDSSVVGILLDNIILTQNGALPTRWIEVTGNSLDLDNYKHTTGILIKGRGDSSMVDDHLFVDGNSIYLHGSKHINNVHAYGIRLSGEGFSCHDLRLENNLVSTSFGVPPRLFGIHLAEMELSSPMVAANNKVDFDGSRDQSAGIYLRDLHPLTTSNSFLGNNAISMPAHVVMNRGIFVTDVARLQIHHNSVHLYGSPSSLPGAIAMDVNAIDLAENYAIGIWNNIFASPAGAKAIRIDHGPAVSGSDFNLLWGGFYPVLGEYAGSTANSLSSWQTLSGDDANSVTGHPVFTSNSDLHISMASPAYQAAALKFYPPYASVLKSDFESDLRGGPGNREMGADELGGQFHKAHASAGDTGLNVYPNPAVGQVQVELPAGNQWQLRIVDMSGKIVREVAATTGRVDLDLSDLPRGMYLLRADSPGGSQQAKLVLN